MNIQKIAIIAAAILINVLALAGFHALTVVTVASATAAPAANVVTLPTIHVHPSAAELRALGRPVPAATSVPPQANAGGGPACIEMPFYSFAAQCDAAVRG